MLPLKNVLDLLVLLLVDMREKECAVCRTAGNKCTVARMTMRYFIYVLGDDTINLITIISLDSRDRV